MFDDIPAGNISRFRPTTLRQFLIFHIAFRFDDLRNLGRYLNGGIAPPRAQLLSAAIAAERQTFEDGSPAPENFWRLLGEPGKEAA